MITNVTPFDIQIVSGFYWIQQTEDVQYAKSIATTILEAN